MDIPELGQNPLVQRVVGKLWGDVDLKDLHNRLLETCSTMTKAAK